MDQRAEQLVKNFTLLTEEQKNLIEKCILAFISINDAKKQNT